VKLFRVTVNPIFMIYLPLICGRIEVLQGYSPPCPRRLTLGCTRTRILKYLRGHETIHTSSLQGSVAPLKCHFVRPS